jgi:2-amino-4-hydroxy-6-hydroxymethyldihydropteridine diphosphokinase
MSDADAIDLPPWAEVTPKRRAHIARVVVLLRQWASAMQLDAADAARWIDAGRLHDALRDADEAALREATGDRTSPVGLLHGPAAARRLRADGESRAELLSAIASHTIGDPAWSRTGRALYMADFLEPGRPFSQADRAFLAAQVPHAFDDVFRQVVRVRLEWTLREGKEIFPGTIALWNSVR